MDESTAPAGTATAPTAASLELCGAIQALMEAATAIRDRGDFSLLGTSPPADWLATP